MHFVRINNTPALVQVRRQASTWTSYGLFTNVYMRRSASMSQLTWLNFNPNLDKSAHAQYSVWWFFLYILKR